VWESPDGHLFVTDAGNKRVQSFTPDGKPLAQWPMGESTARDGNRLSGTSTGDALLTQYDSKSIIEYAPDGTEKARWQYAPQGVALIPAGIGQAGDNKYIVLFQFDNVAGIFDFGH
jgi:streptogramin lyase